MKTRIYLRSLLLCFGFAFLSMSAALVRPASAGRPIGAGKQNTGINENDQIKRVGEIPGAAKAENFRGDMAGSEQIRLLLEFKLRHSGRLQRLISELYDPASPRYHQWLTSEQFAEAFGRKPEEFDRAVTWLAEQGMEVDRAYPDRMAIGFTGTVDAVERAFNTRIGMFWDARRNRLFYSNTTLPTLPPDIDAMTAGLAGLNNAVLYHRHSIKRTPLVEQNAGPGAQVMPEGKVGQSLFLLPRDLALLYDYQPLWNSNFTGGGLKVGIVIDSDIRDSDMSTYRTDAGLQPANVQRALFPGFSNPGLTAGEVEADLDAESVSAVAPSTEIDLVLIPSLDSVSIQTVELDIISNGQIHVVNESFGTCESEGYSSAEQNIFASAVAHGIAFFASSGDEGADCDETNLSLHGIECPACYPGVTAVGGTTLSSSFDSQGNVTSRLSEVVWNDSPGVRPCGGGSSGGGVSINVATPAYQQSSQGFAGGVPAGNNRFVPDVSAVADPGESSLNQPGLLLVNGGSRFYGGGTSQSSPLLAGMMAIINQAKGSPQGSPNAVLYQQGVNQYKNGGPHAFVDVTSGNNNVALKGACVQAFAGLSARTGYDAVSGWGAPDVNLILQGFSGGGACVYALSGSSQNFASAGGSGSFGVVTTPGCTWTAVPRADWVTITSGSSGSGPGTVNFSVGPNYGLARAATVTIAGQVFTIEQAAGCAFRLSAASQSFGSGGGSGTVAVTPSDSSCGWTAISNANWITINSGADGSGPVNYTVSANPGPFRSGTMTVAAQAFTVTQSGAGKKAAADFDGDGKTDLSIWRPSTGEWWVIDSSTGGFTNAVWGRNNDIPVPGDYDGDGKTDLAYWRPSTGVWSIINSSNGSVRTVGWGIPGDVPVAADYDGDGKTDIAIWRPSTGVWWIINSSNGAVRTVGWGFSTDIPVIGDFDGDGKSDIAIWRPSTGQWWIISSSTGSFSNRSWGISGDVPAPGDYDGDGKTDLAVWQASTGLWSIINSSTGLATLKSWGVSGDVPVPADYDGDGKTDVAVWRPSTGQWWIISSLTGAASNRGWGFSTDIPLPPNEIEGAP